MSIFDSILGLFRGGGGQLPIVTIGDGFYQNTVTVSNDIDKLEKSLRDMTEPLTTSLHEAVIPAIRKNFQSEGRPSWRRLSDETVRIRDGQAHPILYRTGDLYRAATQASNWTITNTSLTQTRMPLDYGLYHTTGTRFMPARPFTTLTAEDKAKIVDIFDAWVAVQIEKKGRFRRR